MIESDREKKKHISSNKAPKNKESILSFLEFTHLTIGIIYLYESQVMFLYGKYVLDFVHLTNLLRKHFVMCDTLVSLGWNLKIFEVKHRFNSPLPLTKVTRSPKKNVFITEN